MKHLIIGGLAALAIGLGIPAPAGADPTTECCEHEFDWAQPYYEAFERHEIGYLAFDEGIPLINAAKRFCRGTETLGSIWANPHYDLTRTEAKMVVEAAEDVCPGTLR